MAALEPVTIASVRAHGVRTPLVSYHGKPAIKADKRHLSGVAHQLGAPVGENPPDLVTLSLNLRENTMWITFWAVTIALAIGLSVMAIGTQPKKTMPRRLGGG
jgi:hypothetical protein